MESDGSDDQMANAVGREVVLEPRTSFSAYNAGENTSAERNQSLMTLEG